MRPLVTLSLFACTLIEILLIRIGRDAGGRVDTRYFVQSGHVSALRLAALALAVMGGADARNSALVAFESVTGLFSVHLLVLFAYSFPLNRPTPRSLHIPLGIFTVSLSLLTVVARRVLFTSLGPALMLLYVVPYFGLTLYFLQRNWRASIAPGDTRPSTPIILVQASIVVPWAFSLVGFAVLHAWAGHTLSTWLYLVQALAMSLVVFGGTSVAVLRYHLFEVRVLVAEVVMTVVAATVFACYVTLGAAPLYGFLATRASPAFAAAVVAGVWPLMFRSLYGAFDKQIHRVTCAVGRGVQRDNGRSVVERVMAVTARMVDPDGVLAMVSASVAEATQGDVTFLRVGKGPPRDRPEAPPCMARIAREHPRPFFSFEQCGELPPILRTRMDEMHAQLVVPVSRHDTLYGLLVISGAPPVSRDAALLSATLADHLALKLENFALYAEAALASRELADYKAFLENLVESLPVGVAVVDNGLTVRSWNASLARQTGIAADKAVGRHYFDDLNPGLLEAAGAEVIESLKEDPSRVITLPAVPYTTPAGDAYRDVVVAPFRDRRGKPTGVVVITQDVTERVRLGRELEESRRLASLGAFAAAIAHDIRTPLTSIQMNVQILRSREWMKDGDREYLDIAIEEIERLNRSVGEILDYAKPLALAVTPTDPGELVDEVARTLEPVYAERGLTLAVTHTPGDATVPVDERRMRQVLVNLLDNAAAASQHGTTVELRSRYAPEGVVFEVEDHGRGISEGNLGRIFEPFFTTRADGTGLGLAIAQKVVRAHGGDIRVRSEVGRGSVFTVVLPGSADARRRSFLPLGGTAAPMSSVAVISGTPTVVLMGPSAEA